MFLPNYKKQQQQHTFKLTSVVSSHADSFAAVEITDRYLFETSALEAHTPVLICGAQSMKLIFKTFNSNVSQCFVTVDNPQAMLSIIGTITLLKSTSNENC